MSRSSRSSGASTDRSTLGASAGLGVVAAAVGYLLSFLLIRGEVAEHFEDVAEWKGVAWYHYNAHMVELESSGQFGGFGGTTTVDLIAESGSTNAELLYLIPPLVLLGTGAFLAHRLDASDLGEAVAVGAPITIGYAVVLGLGALVAESSREGTVFGVEASGSTAPELLPAIVLAGIMYPLVFATAGAVARTLVASR